MITVGRSTALVFQHDPTIHLGNLGPVLEAHGYDLVVVDITATDDAATGDTATGDAAPDDAGFDVLAPALLVVLGGEMGAYQGDEFPFLRREIALVRRRLEAELPILGVCLGAQIMAAALGAEVYRGTVNDIGYRVIRPTEAGMSSPVRHVSGVSMLEWHGDTFELPGGVTLLAESDACRTEAFAIGEWALAVQFHPEVTADMHEDWVQGSTDELAAEGIDADELRAERDRYSGGMQDASRMLLSEFLDALATRRTP